MVVRMRGKYGELEIKFSKLRGPVQKLLGIF